MNDLQFIKIDNCIININNINYLQLQGHKLTISFNDKDMTISLTDSQMRQLDSLIKYREIK